MTRIERERRQLATALDRAAAPGWRFARGRSGPIDPVVRAACMPSLRTIAAALRVVDRTVDEESVAAVRAFLSDEGSPLFGRDAGEAVREAVRLQHLVIETQERRAR